MSGFLKRFASSNEKVNESSSVSETTLNVTPSRTDCWDGFTEAELSTFEDFKAKIKDLTCKEIESGNLTLDDKYIMRFLIARDFDLKKAFKMFETHLAWRDEMMPSQITSEDLPNVFNTGIYRLLGKTKTGVNVVLSQSKYTDPSKYDLEEFVKYVVYTAEKSISLMDEEVSTQHLWVFDLSGWTVWKDGGMKASKMTQALVSIAQDHYPERLMKSLIINAPTLFSAFWNIIYPFIDNATRAKVQFGKPKMLVDYINREDLPVEYGGTKQEEIPLWIDSFQVLKTQ